MFNLTMPDLPGALCVEVDPAIFFPGMGETIKAAQAKAVCAACPQRLACLDYAIADPSLMGIWGGLTVTERARLSSGTGSRCGTRAGYDKHRRDNERACPACLHANRVK